MKEQSVEVNDNVDKILLTIIIAIGFLWVFLENEILSLIGGLISGITVFQYSKRINSLSTINTPLADTFLLDAIPKERLHTTPNSNFELQSARHVPTRPFSHLTV